MHFVQSEAQLSHYFDAQAMFKERRLQLLQVCECGSLVAFVSAFWSP